MNYNFDRVADRYDATRGFPPGVADRLATWVLSRLPKDPAVAEIGVGTGRIAIPFIERGVRYSGFDISEQMMARLRTKLNGDLRRSQIFAADITEPLPVPAESQDAVIAVHIFHLVDAVKALEQVRRILKPHGALVWGYNLDGDLAPHRRIRQQFYKYVVELGGPQQREFWPQGVRELLARWGTQVSQHTPLVWTETETPRQALAELNERIFSSVWHLPDEIFAAAAARTEEWTRAEYGDLDQPCAFDVRFVVDWYQF